MAKTLNAQGARIRIEDTVTNEWRIQTRSTGHKIY